MLKGHLKNTVNTDTFISHLKKYRQFQLNILQFLNCKGLQHKINNFRK